jgi:hypothetical protein
MSTMPVAIPWFKSPQTIGLITTFVAAAVALFPKAGIALGLTSPGAISTAVSNVAGVIALLAPLVGTIFRVNSDVQPITLTQAAADNHPATVAAQVVAKVNAQNARTAELVVAMQHRKNSADRPAPTVPSPVAVDPTKPWGKA